MSVASLVQTKRWRRLAGGIIQPTRNPGATSFDRLDTCTSQSAAPGTLADKSNIVGGGGASNQRWL